MSAAPTAQAAFTPLSTRPDRLPGLVRVGLEYERRGLPPPRHVASLVGEFRRRGYVDPLPNAPFDLTPEGQQRRAAMRFEQIESSYQPPSDAARQEYVDRRYQERLDRLMQAQIESASYERQHDTDLLGRLMIPDRLTYAQREEFYRSLNPEIERKARERFAAEFDALHSPEAEFTRRREQLGQQLAESYRHAYPSASDQEVYRHVQEELAEQGYTPAGAGQLPVVRDEATLRQALAQLRRQDAPLVDRGLSLLGVGDAAAGVLRSLPQGLNDVVNEVGVGGVASALEKTFGTDLGLRDVQESMRGYYVDRVAAGPLRQSERPGAQGEYQRIAGLLGQVAGDLGQMLVLSRIGASGAQVAGLSARLQRLTAVLTSTGYMGAKEGGGAYRQIYRALRDKGYDHATANDRAAMAGISVGVVNALLERAPVEAFVLANPQRISRLRGALHGMIAEGSTEAAQEAVNILAEFEAGAAARGSVVSWDNFKRIATASLAGAAVGGGVGAITGGRGVAADVQDQFEAERLAAVMEAIERAQREQQQRQQAQAGPEPGTSAERPDQSPPPTPKRGTDPRVIATPKQMGSWYSRRFNDPTNAAAIEALAATAGERFRLVDIPLSVLDPNTLGTPGETDPAKVEAIAGLTDQEIADLPPIVTILNPSGTGRLTPIDGNHRTMALLARGDTPTIRGYVPESVARQIEAGTFAPPSPTQAPPPEPAVGPPETAPPLVEPPPVPEGAERSEPPAGPGGAESEQAPGPSDSETRPPDVTPPPEGRAEPKRIKVGTRGGAVGLVQVEGEGREPVTGQPVTATVYRGHGRADKGSVYAEGTDDQPVLGPGLYYALDEETARQFGPQVEKRDITLQNPYVITAHEDVTDITGQRFPTSIEEYRQQMATLRRELERRGHDGVIIQVPQARDTDSRGRNAKRLRSLFGDTQIVVFGEQQTTPAPPAADDAPREVPFTKKSLRELVAKEFPELGLGSRKLTDTYGLSEAERLEGRIQHLEVTEPDRDYARLLARVLVLDKQGELHRRDIGKLVGLDTAAMRTGDRFMIDGAEATVTDATDAGVLLNIEFDNRVETYDLERGRLVPANTGSFQRGQAPTSPRSAEARRLIEESESILQRLREGVARISEQSRRNPLTGGLNRRAFDELVQQAIQEADQSGEPFSVIAFDAANLKTVNDTQGDAAGDAYLKRTMQAILDATRDASEGRRADAFHYGGDEFAVIAWGATAEQARRIMQRAEAAVGRQEIVPGVSAFLVGEVAEYEPNSDTPAGELLAEATNAMKARKKAMKAEAGEAVTREEAERRALEVVAPPTPQQEPSDDNARRTTTEAAATPQALLIARRRFLGDKAGDEDSELDVAGSPAFSPATGAMPPPAGPPAPPSPPAGGALPPTPPAAQGYTQPYNPLVQQPGRFRRTWSDLPAKVKQSLAQARARRDGRESVEADNIYRIISDVSRRFNLGPPGVGRARWLRRAALGFYRIRPEAVRLRRGSYVGTFIHELGHHLHKVMFPRAKVTKGVLNAADFPKHWRKELVLLGRDLYGSKQPNVGGYATEGWAEAVRFLVVNPRHLKVRAPLVYREVVQTLVVQHPETWLVLQEARVRLLNAVRIAQHDPVDQFIAHDAPAPGSVIGALKEVPVRTAYDWLRTRLFDRFQRLRTFTEDLGLNDLPAHLDPHTMALRANGHISGDVKLATERGRFDPADPARTPIGPSLREILEPVKHSLREWQNYMVARRTLEKRAQGYDVLPQDEDLPDQTSNERLRDYIARVESLHPEFREAAEEFQEFNRWLVQDYAVHYGLVSPEAAQLIVDRNLEYITFRHKKTEDALAKKYGVKSSRGGFTGQTSGISRFREGLGEQLFPPLEAFMASMQGIMSRARLNEVGDVITRMFDLGVPGIGRWLDRIDRPVQATRVTPEQLSTEIRRQLGIGVTSEGAIILPPYLQGLSDEQLSGLLESVVSLQGATFWSPSNRTDRNNREVTVLRRGKPVFYEVKDAQLFELLEGLHNPYTTNVLIRLIGLPGRTLRAGATQYNPSFFVPNFARDMVQALTMTETDMAKLPEQARLRLQAMKQAFVGGHWHDLFLASGADMAGIFGEYYNPQTQRIDFEGLFERPRLLGAVKGGSPKRIARDLVRLGPIDRLNRAFELANRLGEFAITYEQAKRRGASEAEAIAEAGQAAADITLDFQRGGTWSKQINEVIVFFNAAMLGADKLARFIRKNPVKAFARITATMIVPSIIQLLLNWDNDDYWAKPLGMRDRYWYFPLPGPEEDGRAHYLRLPKPYGLGVFSIVTERTFSRLLGIDPTTGERGDPGAFRGITQAILNEFRPTLNIAGIQPLVEVMAGDQGYSFYRDAHIVSNGDKDLPLGEQGASRSSELARILGRVMDYPPAKIDYLIQGWLGGLGRDFVQVGIDPVIRLVDPEAKQGEPIEFSDWLVIRRFMAGKTRSGHEAITRFYDVHERLKRINAGLRARQDRPEDYDRYAERYAAELALWGEYAAAERRMNEQWRELRRLYRTRDQMDPDAFNAQADAAFERIIAIAREAAAVRAAQEQQAPPPPEE